MDDKILYAALATAKGGRDGHVRSSDGVLDVDMAIPKEMGGSGGARTNPEQLFAAGYAACFEGAVRLAARQENVAVGADTFVTAIVGIGPRQAGGFQLTIALEVHVDGVSTDLAQNLAKIAHEQICPYSHATRGNIAVQVRIV